MTLLLCFSVLAVDVLAVVYTMMSVHVCVYICVCGGGGVCAPMLFNLYFYAVVASWRSSCPDAGLSFRYKVRRELVGDRTAKGKLLSSTVTESKFADDAALYATSQPAF